MLKFYIKKPRQRIKKLERSLHFLTFLHGFALRIDHGGQGPVATWQGNQILGHVDPGQGVANVFAGDPGIYGLCELGVINTRALCHLADGVFVLAKPPVPLVAEDSKFLYSLTHFSRNPVCFLKQHFSRVPSERFMRVSFIKIKKKTYIM